MAELLLPGDILSMTARAADRLMGAGNGDAALLYLWLLRRGGRLEPEAARRALKWDVPRLEAALSALVGLGLADGTAAPEAPLPRLSKRAVTVNAWSLPATTMVRSLSPAFTPAYSLAAPSGATWTIRCPA